LEPTALTIKVSEAQLGWVKTGSRQDSKAEGDPGCRQSELARARHEAQDPASRCNPIERDFQQGHWCCGPKSMSVIISLVNNDLLECK